MLRLTLNDGESPVAYERQRYRAAREGVFAERCGWAALWASR